MSLQSIIVVMAVLAAVAHFLRGPLGSLFGRGSCATGGCSGCSAACSMRRAAPGGGTRSAKLSPGNLP